MNPSNFFTELKRRNIYGTAVLYGMVAWLLAQIATRIFPSQIQRCASLSSIEVGEG